ncbi:MAG: S1 RNA-binding domain-containing protein, partial [Planctomycetota bacterium]
EGLLHISELADHKVDNPEEIVSVGEEIEVKILRVDTDDRKIGLSRKRVEWAEEETATAESQPQPAGQQKPQQELKGGLGDAGPLIKPAGSGEDADNAAVDDGNADNDQTAGDQ